MKKEIIELENVFEKIDFLMEDIQSNIFNNAHKFTKENIRTANTYDEFKSIIKIRVALFLPIGMDPLKQKRKLKRN